MAPNSSAPSSSTTSRPSLPDRLQALPVSRDIATPSASARESQDVGSAAEPGRRSVASAWESAAARTGAASSGSYRASSQSTPPTASGVDFGSMIHDERRGEEVQSFSRHTSDRSNSLSTSAISNGSPTDVPSSSSRGAGAGQSGQLTARDRWLAASSSNAGPSSRPIPASAGPSRYGGIELSRSSSAASDGSFRRGSNGSAAYPQPAGDSSAPRRLASGVSDRERPPPGAVERYRAALDGRPAEAGPSGSSPSKGYGASTVRSAQASTSTLASPSRAGNLARATSPPPSAPAQESTAQAHALKSQEREEREKEVNRVRRRRKLLKAQIAKRSSGGARSSATGSGSSDSRRLSGGTAMSATSTGSGNGRTSSLGTEDDDLLEGDLQDLSSGEEDELSLLSRDGDSVRVLNVWKEDAQAGGPSQSPAREPGVRVTPASPGASRSNSRLAQTSPLLSVDRSLAADGDQSRATIISTSTLHGSPIDARTDGGRASVTPSIASSLGDDSFYDAVEDGTPESPARLRQRQLEASSAADAGDMAAWQLPGIDLGGDLDAVGVEDDGSELHRLMRPRLRQSTGDFDTPSGSVAGDQRDDAEEAQGTGSSATLRQDAQAYGTPLRDSLPSVGERSNAVDDPDQKSRRRQVPARLSRLPIDDQDAFARAQAIVDSAAGWNSSGVSSPSETAETFLGDRDDDTAGRSPSSSSRADFGNNANEYDPSRTLSDSDLSSTLAYIATQDLTSAATDASLSQLTSGGTSIMSDSGSAFSGPNSPGSPMDSSAPNPSRLFFASTPADGAASLPQSTNNSSYSRRSAVILPPARPSPTSPLPAPPDGAVPYSSSSRTSTPVAESAQAFVSPSTSTSRLATTELAKGRSRSHSLGQAAQELIPPASLGDMSPVPAVPHVVFANNVSGTSPRSSALSLSGDNNDTLRGRPRGKTIGSVPPHSSVKSGSTTRARPRSLLSNELLPFSSPEESVATLAEINIEPPYRNTLQRPREEASHGIVSATSTSLSSNPSSLGLLGAPSLPTAPSTVADARSVGAASAEMRDAALDRERDRERERRTGAPAASAPANVANTGTGNRSRSGSNASLLQQVQHPPKSHASFVIAVAGHRNTGKSTVIKKGLRQFGLSKPNVLSEKVTSHSTVCVVDQEQRTIEVLEIDASVLLNGPGKRFAWPKFLPHIDAVILCYDAGQISSFRGMSELLENFAIERLSIVMLACKSEISPKQVDPYYASDMAGVYNVGLAECTVQSEEGKKRMRDCFSYLVKEVAKARTGRLRKAAAQQAALQIPDTNAGSMAPRSLSGMAEIGHSGRLQETDDYVNTMAPSSSQASVASSSIRDRNNSGASSTMDSIPSGGSSAISYPQVTSALAAGDAGAPVANEARYPLQQQQQPTAQQQAAHWVQRDPQRERNVRKLSDATTSSVDAPSIAGSNSEDDAIVQQSISKAKLGLQSAKAVGGYVTIEELWDKFFFAAVSGNDERFLLMFMVFYRGFARPLDLLVQMRTRFDALSNSERSDGVMIRFSLTRLTTTLSEWVQDYPGDLSAPDTYPVLLSFYARLLQHPSTTHIAATLHPHIEAARHAFDPDAVWSKVEDSDKPQSIAADVPPLGQQKVEAAPAQHLGTGALGLRAATESNSDLSMRLTSSANASSSSLPQPGYLGRTSSGTDAGSVELLRARGYLTDSLSTGVAIGGSRHRSASDATTSSQEVGNGVGGGGGVPSPMVGSPTGGGTSTPGGGSQPTSPPPVPPVLSDKAAQQQKLALRSLSNALAELDDEAIASELTRLEWALFTAIRPRDLLRHILVARDVRDPAGPVARSIAHFNYISYWVCSVVLIQGKTKARARMLEKFMNVAAILRRENNYNTLHSVLAGLGNASVHRLKQTRELLNGKQIIKTYQSLARLMGSDRSFAAYRLALENSDGRTIPYLGVHLQDILSMSDGNPSKRASDGMIHWRKFILMDEAVMAIVRCQRYERTGARPNLAVEKLIMEAPVMDEETLWQRSLQVEPRSSASQPSKIKKLMQGHAA